MAAPETNIQYLKGVGPSYAKRFAKLGIQTLGDLLAHYPRKYIAYTHPYPVAEAPFDLECCVKAEVVSKEGTRRIPGGRTLTRVLACDESGSLSLTARAGLPRHRGTGQQLYRQMRPHRAGKRGEPARAAARRSARKVSSARQDGGRAQHPSSGQRRGGRRGQAAAHL